ncbi:MAG TPA: hypothetical protein VF163_06785 [Micromonosporaceae bacterium]
MADGSHPSLTVDAPAIRIPTGLVAGVKSFAAEHGGATAIIEYLGRRGARVVLVGTDGVWGDQFAETTEIARAACERAGVSLSNEWERELTEQMRPSHDLWRSMGRKVFRR